jgi:tripartite-type tricarboxylate transporter receptor subunit TctC
MLLAEHPTQEKIESLKEARARAEAEVAKQRAERAALIERLAGVTVTHVPYKGGGPIANDVLGGHLAIGVVTPISALGFHREKRVNSLAVTSPRRLASLPDVPTVAESGFPGFSAQGWFGLFGPANLPPKILETLNKAVTDALREPEVIARFEKLGVQPDPQTPAAFAKFLEVESAKWGDVAKSLKLELN